MDSYDHAIKTIKHGHDLVAAEILAKHPDGGDQDWPKTASFAAGRGGNVDAIALLAKSKNAFVPREALRGAMELGDSAITQAGAQSPPGADRQDVVLTNRLGPTAWLATVRHAPKNALTQQDYEDALLIAVGRGQLQMTELILRNHFSLNSLSRWSRSGSIGGPESKLVDKIFNEAVDSGSVPMMELLMKLGFSFVPNGVLESPMRKAVLANQVKLVERLLKIPDIADNAKENLKIDLRWAAEKGHHEVVGLLIDAGVRGLRATREDAGRAKLEFQRQGKMKEADNCQKAIDLLIAKEKTDNSSSYAPSWW